MTEIFALLVAALLIVADQLTKTWVMASFKLFESKPVIDNILNFTYVHNFGAAFGILENNRWIFISVTTVVIIVGLVMLVLRKFRSKLLIWAAALVISGGIGNMIDRVYRGYVVDFIDVQFVNFFVFNIADCCVVIGAMMMILYFLMDTVKEYKVKKADTNV